MDRDGAVTGQLVPAALDGPQGRLRSVRLGPDAALYLTADNGSDDEVVRVTPTGRPARFEVGSTSGNLSYSAAWIGIGTRGPTMPRICAGGQPGAGSM